MRGRRQLKDSKGRWVRDSHSLMIPYHQWKMWGIEQGLAALLTNGPMQNQREQSQGGNSLFCSLQIKSFAIALLITILTLRI